MFENKNVSFFSRELQQHRMTAKVMHHRSACHTHNKARTDIHTQTHSLISSFVRTSVFILHYAAPYPTPPQLPNLLP